MTCQLLSPFLRSRRPGQLNYCGRIRPTTLIVGTETGHFPADEPNSVVWSSCSSVCGSFSVGARRRDGACSGSLACSRRPFLCVWKPRPVRLCLGLLAPLSAPLPSAVFFLASLRRALGIPPSTAQLNDNHPPLWRLSSRGPVQRLPWRRLWSFSHYQPVGVLCAAGQRFVVQRHFVHQPQQHGNSGGC